MNKGYCDLHTHTVISDGIYTPEELIQRGINEGLAVLCMTDHNAINPNLPVLIKKYPQIELPFGAEFSSQYTTVSGRLIQIHIGGIDFDPDNRDIQSVLKHNKNSMRPYLEKTLQKLKTKCDIDLGSYDSLVKQFNRTNINRKHIALALTQRGFSGSIEDAFDTYLNNKGGVERPAYVSNAKYFATMEEVIHAITSSGGVAFLCHLFDYIEKSNLNESEIHGLLSDFKDLACSRGAMEVYYGSYSREQTEILKQLADDHHLIYSAGSDFHGDGRISELGKYPYEIYAQMKLK